jgi:predicted pyridoxine 5'-phosphate oxidase superfamily flavin-nucleotide-binding protein
MNMQDGQLTEWGFHDGELTVQQRAGVRADAERLTGMLAPVELRGGVVGFLTDRTFAVITARDNAGSLWSSPLNGEPGFLTVTSPTTLRIRTTVARRDPLDAAPDGQPVGLVVMEFAARRRVRINGTLTGSDNDGLTVEVEQAYGNCPQYIQQRILAPNPESRPELEELRSDVELSGEDVAQIRAADTFFLGTTHPTRGKDASHRGGPAGFVRLEGNDVWWPDYPGNNMFNSFGNLTVAPTAALLFVDFDSGRTLQLSGTASIEWDHRGEAGDDGHTGRRARFHTERVVAGHLHGIRQTEHHSYPRNPALT